MFGFIFRLARRSAVVKRSRFLALTLTIAAASALLVILSALYLNAESQLSFDLSGVPNMVIEPKSDIAGTTPIVPEDVNALKSEAHFWRNNVITAAPVLESETVSNGKSIRIAGTWYRQEITVNNEKYALGLLTFKGWEYTGREPGKNEVVVGANIAASESVNLTVNGETRSFEIAGRLETGSYWDDYIFLEMCTTRDLLGRDVVDKILVSALIKPKDELALRVEQYGEKTLSDAEFEKWYCSPYTSSIAYTIQEVLPHTDVRILRRVTEVQEGIIRASTGVFLALFVLTLVGAVTAIFSAEKMYVTSHMQDIGIMAALGGSRQKIFLQITLELTIAAFLSGLLAYGVSALLLDVISNAVFQIDFQSQGTLMITSLIIPFATMFLALLFVRKSFTRDTIELLRNS